MVGIHYYSKLLLKSHTFYCGAAQSVVVQETIEKERHYNRFHPILLALAAILVQLQRIDGIPQRGHLESGSLSGSRS
jgi:hypothetical protein